MPYLEALRAVFSTLDRLTRLSINFRFVGLFAAIFCHPNGINMIFGLIIAIATLFEIDIRNKIMDNSTMVI